MDAALEGARIRLRPLLMTSFAFILGLCAALDGLRRRLRGSPDHGDDRDWRHGGGDVHRQILCSGDLLSGGEMVRLSQATAGDGCSPVNPCRRRGSQMRNFSLILVMGAATLMSACAVGPNYHRPDVQIPDVVPRVQRIPSKRNRRPHRSPICPGGKCSRTRNCKS